MTPDKQTLCRKIAEAEGHKVSQFGRYIIHAERLTVGPVPIMSYLTDPAETVRMLEALVSDGVVKLTPTGEWGTCVIKTRNISYGCDSIPRAVAEAFKAMLEERLKHAREGER